MQLNTVLNEELRRLDRWLQGNKLSLNVAKTRSMLITTKQKKKYLTASNKALQPSIREEYIEVICHSKYLGVQIDENLFSSFFKIKFLCLLYSCNIDWRMG